jgi:drug/metabolite transporter (DMT)-like permease
MTSDLTTMTAGSLALFLVLGAGVGFAGGLIMKPRLLRRLFAVVQAGGAGILLFVGR